MVEHVSRSHEVPSSNLGRLLLHFKVSINVVIFFVVLRILVVVRAILLPTLLPQSPRSASAVELSFCRISSTLSLSTYIPHPAILCLGISPRARPSELQAHVKWDTQCLSQGHRKVISSVLLTRTFVTRTFVSVRFRATRPFLNKTPSSTT